VRLRAFPIGLLAFPVGLLLPATDPRGLFLGAEHLATCAARSYSGHMSSMTPRPRVFTEQILRVCAPLAEIGNAREYLNRYVRRRGRLSTSTTHVYQAGP